MMSFADVVLECFDNKELVANFERLYSVKLSSWRPPRNAIEAMVDKACGANPVLNEDAVRRFIRFVWDCVWTRLPPECFAYEPCDCKEGEDCPTVCVTVREHGK